MKEGITFKFKFLDDDGNEASFLSKKGYFDGNELTLDEATLPVETILRVDRRFDNLILQLLQEDGETGFVALAIKKGPIRELSIAINGVSSARWAKLRKQALAEEGKGESFKVTRCPDCKATVDLTHMPQSPQVYCTYCETIHTLGQARPQGEENLRLCDECGFYAVPSYFTVFYFYFLLVIYGWNYGKRYMCHSCMRGNAWKMLFLNLPFLLGVPNALYQLFRIYTGGDRQGRIFAGLDKANHFAKTKKLDMAADYYDSILRRINYGGGVHYSRGLGHFNAGQFEDAVAHLRKALADCGNYFPAYHLLIATYEEMGNVQAVAELQKTYHAVEASEESVIPGEHD
ncbi:hypothetical protein SCOR_31300 [Sulfidibacter corallicola]|uniref:Tetratricopeptide repeat protein n=1 Tax=Sulfidibacter corallicola TaxID=2818388 RepID=A0A8A4TLH5_SULCO|nr:hypothetical protein [Sulfidibacter corallicola]QTD49962.1 hypothetical protein J3U87_30640 [Sulfidibacter corallicola]